MMARFLARFAPVRKALAPPALAAALVLTAPVALPAPAAAQEQVSEARLRKIEAEIRALQRNVFPGGDGRFFEPQIRPGETASPSTGASGAAASAPSTTAVTDILARLDALELQLQRLTALSEENANAIALLTTRVAAVEAGPSLADADAAPALASGETTQMAAADADGEGDVAEDDSRATASNLAAMGAGPAPLTRSTLPQGSPASGASGATGPSPERLAAVQAIAMPQTDDPGDDEYSYGFRLWDAGFYPEARQQLAKFLEEYPDHWRATYGRNLLGRAYLDDGKAEDAARWFLRNYQADRNAVRAPDSLLFLAESMIALGDNRRACIALAGFADTYPAFATGRLMEEYQANRARVTCES
ncbi:MAG: tetratricopeptide repeat protein [Erythrobacter sp.]|jgi:TolA-binding protein|nr:tetratricopeptide repeat protein [Erythrobacter sp.]